MTHVSSIFRVSWFSPPPPLHSTSLTTVQPLSPMMFLEDINGRVLWSQGENREMDPGDWRGTASKRTGTVSATPKAMQGVLIFMCKNGLAFSKPDLQRKMQAVYVRL